MSRYTKLKEDYDFLKKQNELLEKEVDHRWDNIHSLQEEVKTLKDQLMEAKLELGKTNAKLQSVINSNKTNSDVIQYLAARRFGDDPTYRDCGCCGNDSRFHMAYRLCRTFLPDRYIQRRRGVLQADVRQQRTAVRYLLLRAKAQK